MASVPYDPDLLDLAVQHLGIDGPIYQVRQLDEHTIELTTPYAVRTFRRPPEGSERTAKPKKQTSRPKG